MKKSLADRIEQYIKVLIERSEEQQIEIQRIELAETFACVPSQVTYVIATRFTEEAGYYTQSRRGGKGYVRIAKFDLRSEHPSTQKEIVSFIDELYEYRIINDREKKILRFLTVNMAENFTDADKPLLYGALRKALEKYAGLS